MGEHAVIPNRTLLIAAITTLSTAACTTGGGGPRVGMGSDSVLVVRFAREARELPVPAAMPIVAPTQPGASATPAKLVPSIWPVNHPATQVISPFGMRGRHLHKGMDIKAPRRTPVLATADGVVSYVGVERGYGNVVKILHANDIETLYAHLNNIDVQQGAAISQGQTIGAVGSTGNASTPHVHYEVIQGNHVVNPHDFLPAS